MSRRAYHEYKPSRSQCLDQVPERWDERRLKFLISQKVTDGPHETPEFITKGVPFLSVDGIQDDRLVFEGCRFISPEKHAHYKVKCFPRKGDILLGKAASVGKVAIVDVDFEFNIWSPLALIRANKSVLPKYIYYSFKAKPLQDQILNLSTSNTQHNLSMDDIPELWLTFPDVEEQSTILDFLDRETVKINVLLANEERLVELLQERRITLISHAVTKGLDPNVPMKDSGVDWLGEIPAHWEVKRFRRLARLQQGLQIAQADRLWELGENRYRYITIKSIHEGNVANKEYVENPPASVICHEDDILLARTGATGEVISGVFGAFHNNFFKVEYDSNQANKNYLIYYLSHSTVKQHILLLAGTTTIPDLNHDEFLDMPFICPPLPEQRAIAKALDNEIAKLGALIAKVREAIEKLKEYRIALISAAVTGKIDVRGNS